MKINRSNILLSKVVFVGKLEIDGWWDTEIFQYKLENLEDDKEFFAQISESILDTPFIELIPCLSENLTTANISSYYKFKSYYEMLEYCIIASDGESQQTVKEYTESLDVNSLRLPFKFNFEYYTPREEDFSLSDKLPIEYSVKKGSSYLCGWLSYPNEPVFSSTEEPESFTIPEIASFFADIFEGEVKKN
ncbi:hypothetical protein FK486_0176 [Listeria phage LP-066]|uniref:Uncharacterized protein n=1 Tax=Listeria phage LP-066 TaxID=2590051 RepID=A0A514U7T1_9CAUD|nr:hypothetical protein FK486_0176 [Listeria phage LP-066]